jgi:hypothetical protein
VYLLGIIITTTTPLSLHLSTTVPHYTLFYTSEEFNDLFLPAEAKMFIFISFVRMQGCMTTHGAREQLRLGNIQDSARCFATLFWLVLPFLEARTKTNTATTRHPSPTTPTFSTKKQHKAMIDHDPLGGR